MAAAELAYVPTLPRVRQALATLVDLRAHRSLAGYLCVLNAATVAQRENELRPDFKAFFDRFFRIGAAPQNKPYAVPFAATPNAILFNANVAGSYAPSSIRAASPLHGVMVIEGGGNQAVFSLRLNHATIARQVILPKPLPLYAFSTFFYRDIGFTSPPTREDIEQAVRIDFGPPLGDALYESGVFTDDFGDFSQTDFDIVEAAE